MNILEYCLFGFISGFAEFLPISSNAHGILISRLFGITDVGCGARLAVHVGMLLSLLLLCNPEISKISRERRIAAVAPKRRKRRPDPVCLLDWKILKTASAMLVLGFIAYPWVWDQGLRLWILGAGLVFNGILLYIPQFLPGANKDAQTLTGLDAACIGFGGALGVLPGVSRMGSVLSVSQMRGCDRNYSVHLALILSVPALILLCILDVIGMFLAGLSGISFLSVFGAIFAGVASSLGAYLGISCIRFLSVRAGYTSFAFYCWGVALFAWILYLAT